jgi:RHS repeat-associated protein
VQSTISNMNTTNPKLNYTITGPATTIGWGPNGHPMLVTTISAGTTTNDTLHWDGDTILFVTNASGAVTDVKVGLDGDVTPHDIAFTGLSVYDRDPAGVIMETSNVTGSTGFNPLDPNTVSGAGAAGTTGYQAAVVPDQYVRGDGFMVAGVQINGVRAFDPNIGAWTTPDAYEGDVHDPASQQRYMFNRGNAVDYSDPTGYAAWWQDALSIARRLLRGESPFVSSTERLEKGLTTSSGALTKLGARVMGTLREAAMSRGNFGLGSVGDVQQAKALGDIWVGDGARPLSNALGKISRDGRRIFRDPVIKSNGDMQANFEVRDANGNVIGNGHLEIRPGGGINVSPEYIRGRGTPPQ